MVSWKEVARDARTKLIQRVPVTKWAPKLTKRMAMEDLIGGFIVGVMIVPTSLSWASLAGLPLSCGLSAALFASFSYGTFGQCAVLSIGPVAEITTLLISISGVPESARQDVFQSLGVQVGVLSIILSFIDGGTVIKTIFAKAVGDGYTCAAALLAICVQIKVMFNVMAPAATLIQDVLLTTIKALYSQWTSNCLYSFLLFLIYAMYLIYIKRFKLPIWIPHQLIIVVLSTTITWYFRLDKRIDLRIVGDIPSGLSLPSFPPIKNIIGLGPYTVTITMISFVQMFVIAQRVMPDIDPNAELFASGVTNFLVNIFSGMPVTNSFGCSSVLLEQKVNTPLTAYGAGMVVLITIVFLTRLGAFYYLPKHALAAIVVASVSRLLDFSGPMKLWRYSKKDAAVWIFTFILTIFGGITIGVLSGIGLSLILVVLRIARPRAVSVGFNMTKFRYGDLSKDPELLVYPNILLWRFDAPLFFVNVGYFQQKLLSALNNEVRPIDVVLVTCGKIVDIDAAALAALPSMLESIARSDPTRHRRIILTEVTGRLEKVLLESEALNMYVPDEYDRLTVAQIEATGKSPVIFKKLEDAIRFAQRCISERYGNVDTAPYPNVSFLTDMVVEAAKVQNASGESALAALINEASITTPPTQSHASDVVLSLPRPQSAADVVVEGSTSPPPGRDAASASPDPQAILGNNTISNSLGGGSVLLTNLEKLKRLAKFSPNRELIGVIGVVRHSELTPKQKKKVLFRDKTLIQLAFKNMVSGRSRREPEELHEFFNAITEGIASGELADKEEWHRVMAIVRSRPQGLKIQVKAKTASRDASFCSFDAHLSGTSVVTAALFVLKWGGVLTNSGISQAHLFGEKLFARFFASGDLPLRRLVTFARNLTVVASDESRVVNTALVVMNALTQGKLVSKKDIMLDDKLMKFLSPTAKRLLHEEYKYYEALLHIDSRASARHFFHIPGFRPLLTVPLLDRPLQLRGQETSSDDDAANDSGHWSVVDGADGVHSDRAYSSMQTTDISLVFGPRATTSHSAHLESGRMDDFYTPLQVLQELEGLLKTICRTQLPHNMLTLPLSNHETVEELRQRYEAMLSNFLGAKSRNRLPASQVLQEQSSSEFAPFRAQRRSSEEEDDKEEEEDSSDEDDDVSGDPVLGELRRKRELTTTAENTESDGTQRPEASMRMQAAASSQVLRTRARARSANNSPILTPEQAYLTRPISPALPQRSKYDVSDVSKLRDYGSYDIAYNLPILRELHSVTHAEELRQMIDAIYRMSKITDSMARVGENVLEGVNSSKKFIIGSLVSGGLLKRIYKDFLQFSRMDEKRCVQDLLWKAQKLHMVEKSSVEQDVKNVMTFLKDIGKRDAGRRDSRERGVDPTMSADQPAETREERAYRLKFPFISLPKDAEDYGGGGGGGGGAPSSRRTSIGRQSYRRESFNHNHNDPSESHARFYFSSYLHVEGLLHCLFESSTIDGFSRPSREELEVSQQMYMKHLVFKVFRRRNVSFTDAEVAAAFRKLPLLFYSGVDYERQQRELRNALSTLYHSMYYVSMEAFLSLGDGDAAIETELFTVYGCPDRPRPDSCREEDERIMTGNADEDHSGDIERSGTPYTIPQTPLTANNNTRPPSCGSSSKWGRPPTAAGSSDASLAMTMPHASTTVVAMSTPLTGSNNNTNYSMSGQPDAAARPSTVPPSALLLSPPAQNGSMLPEVPMLNSPFAMEIASPKLQKRSSSAQSATVLTTPQAGRGAEIKTKMNNRVCNVTPMRRIHEGLSLENFQRLMKEVDSAVESQKSRKKNQ